jgi:serine/threonine protein kinase
MEYADSGTLSVQLTWKDKINMAFQLAHVVLSLHDEGIVHRDLVKFVYFTFLFSYFILLLYYNFNICYLLHLIIALQYFDAKSSKKY